MGIIPDVVVPILAETRKTVNEILGDKKYRLFVLKKDVPESDGMAVRYNDPKVPPIVIKEFIPRPSVSVWTGQYVEQRGVGKEEMGNISVGEIGLELKESELGYGEHEFLALADEDLEVIEFFEHSRRPFPDYQKKIEWRLRISNVEYNQVFKDNAISAVRAFANA